MAQQRNPCRYTLAYRRIPGALRTGTTEDNGALCTEEYRLRVSRDRRAAELRADPRTQSVQVDRR